MASGIQIISKVNGKNQGKLMAMLVSEVLNTFKVEGQRIVLLRKQEES